MQKQARTLYILIAVMLLSLPGIAFAQETSLSSSFTYQGSLNDGSGVVNNLCDFQFGLFDASTAGLQIGSTLTRTNISVSNGVFNVQLDFGGNAFNGTDRYLNIALRCPAGTGSYIPLTPRQALTPTPYALGLYGLEVQQNATSPNLIGGFNGNNVTAGVAGATISGGGSTANLNRATDDYGAIGGGINNQVGNNDATLNNATNATVSGGQNNTASGSIATVGGGYTNTASGVAATIAGGANNTANSVYAMVGGGSNNMAGGPYATIAGGNFNSVNHDSATVGGGQNNTATNDVATVAGGQSNNASGFGATISGGYLNGASGLKSMVGGGEHNLAAAIDATVGGGYTNTASGNSATISGGYLNIASSLYATVGGGLTNMANGNYTIVGGGQTNTASGSYTIVGGGQTNTASGDFATVSGGQTNTASGYFATVGGGQFNTASGDYAIVGGGLMNTAFGSRSFAAGRQAKANYAGTFVWGDDTAADVASTGINQFVVRASGGIWFGTSSTPTFTGFLNTSTGAYLSNGGTWTNSSDRNKKANFLAVDPQTMLQSVVNLPISSWNYTTQDASIRHIGPMAQDFSVAFAVGEDNTHISTIDSEGVALAAIQGLYQVTQDQKTQLQLKDQQITSLESQISTQQTQLNDLATRLAALEKLAENTHPPTESGLPIVGLVGVLVISGTWLSQRKTQEKN
ncbi:MAG: hypothetical protein H0X30_08860 [Anaerolineae bacterium]|nr:hypothetical protein [Anaerolineae bacterium]